MKYQNTRPPARTFRSWKSVVLLVCALLAFPATNANAALPDAGWAGPAGAPDAASANRAKTNPVTDVTMRFTVPALACDRTKAEEHVGIWIGMDSDTDAWHPLTQVGLIGWCLKGDFMDWHGFWETISNNPATADPPATNIPSIGHIQPGSVVTIRLDYVPNIAPDLFLADFKVWNGSVVAKSATQYIQSPYWASRSRGECITERLGKPDKSHWPVAHFGDFTASCVVGATTGAGAHVSDFLPDGSSVWFTAKERGKTYIIAKPLGQFSINFHWLLS
ncbi:G1 family glutamic endopeptidase [Arthrobacter sp. NPDC093128]|uniref:G1 family glutamic endopeptidase n=1 Tax=Arthrobacter sp. NPDC093128 TaxID=3154979 RepID=UPI00343B6CEA